MKQRGLVARFLLRQQRWFGPRDAVIATGENEGAVKVGKLNVDDAPNSAQSYGVSSIPTLMLFKSGEVVERVVGVQTKKRLQDAIDAAKAGIAWVNFGPCRFAVGESVRSGENHSKSLKRQAEVRLLAIEPFFLRRC